MDAPVEQLTAPMPAMQVARWFLAWQEDEDNEGISNLRMQKLLYLAQGHFLASYAVPLFDEDVLAYAHGPVVKSVYDAFAPYGRDPVDEDRFLTDFSWDAYRKVEHDLLAVWSRYGGYTSTVLRNIIYREGPWNAAFCTQPGHVIDRGALRVFFAKTRA